MSENSIPSIIPMYYIVSLSLPPPRFSWTFWFSNEPNQKIKK